MKIGLLTSYRGQKQFPEEFRAIVSYLESKGHQVTHSMDINIEKLIPLSYTHREAIFLQFYKQLEACDLVIAECSLQSTQVGYGLSHIRAKGKPILIMSIKGADPEFAAKEGIYSNVENLMILEYTKDTVKKVLDEGLLYIQPYLEKRFTIIFPANLLAKIEEMAQKKKLPKSVYIRQLIEKDLQ